MENHNQRAIGAINSGMNISGMNDCFIATRHTRLLDMLSKPTPLLSFLAVISLLSWQSCGPAFCQEDDAGSGQTQPAPKPEPKPEAKKALSAEAVKHYNRGLEFHQSGFLVKAIEEYKAAIAADDRLEQAYSNLGLIYISQKSYELAQDAFNKALFLRPNRPTSLNGLASVLYARGKVGPAIENWQKAVEIDPKFASAYFNMGTALESQKKPDEALKVYVRAINIAPDMADAYYHMANLLSKEKHPAQALVLFRKSVELAPESEFARDARKQISGIENQFVKESGKTTKAANKLVGENTITTSTATESPSMGATKREIAETARRDAEKKQMLKEAKAKGLVPKEAPKERGAFFGFGKPKKVDPNLKMFVQPPPQQKPDLYPNKSPEIEP